MDGTIIAAIIAASVAALTSIGNIVLTIHRNKQDGVTYYRMQWIDNVREEFAIILSWNWCSQDEDGNIKVNSIEKLEKSVYKISLYLNVKDNYDQSVLNKTFKYLDAAKKLIITCV